MPKPACCCHSPVYFAAQTPGNPNPSLFNTLRGKICRIFSAWENPVIQERKGATFFFFFC